MVRDFSASLFMTRFVATRAPCRLWLLLRLLLVLGLAVPSAQSQQHPDAFNGMGSTTSNMPGYENRGGAALRITVFAETIKTRLDRQSLVKLNNKSSNTISWQTTDDRSEVGFGDLPVGHYEVEVSAVG